MQVEFCREICRENFELQRENSFSNCAGNLQRAFSFSKSAPRSGRARKIILELCR
ncbi:hypothetical protein [Escherichia phage wV8]|uniref:Uncharacterized protein 13 n=1 Tax=Escherichia phage wV8 TaxID=576791 RepID=C5H7E1_9CAUD|nr:hypothetical protein WV8_gp013 [Escherichia phage wV8]ACJ71825.1 hypothetical protein [Escherichia phage wV8]